MQQSLPGDSSSFDHRDTVTVHVTSESKFTTKDYIIFRKLLEYHSAFFAAALDPASPFGNNNSQHFEIEGDIEVFDVFYGWLYTGRLKDAAGTDKADDVYLSVELLCKVWVFADFRGIPELGNRAIDMLHERFVAEWKTAGHCVRYVYDNTITGSKMRNFLIYWVTMTKDLEDFRSQAQDGRHYTADFLFDVLPPMARRRPQDRVSRECITKHNRCQWHDHSGPGGKLRLETRK